MNEIKEHPDLSDYLDDQGIVEGDRVYVEPLSGKKYSFLLKRTEYDFVTEDIQISRVWKKPLGKLDYESFHVKVTLERNLGRKNVKKYRYRIKVVSGSPIKFNGVWVMEAFLEDLDVVEVGFNRIRFEKLERGSSLKQDHELTLNHKGLIQSKIPILLIGETGVGKTSLARKIHQVSERRGPFVHINISAFVESLVESELFGHVKGAFTGAIVDKIGAFEQAHHGTLFIDEIDSLSTEIQTKLLLFLDDYVGQRVGGRKSYQVDVRVIFSSGSDLKVMVKNAHMRRDFYYRIASGHVLKLPSLRDEPQKIIDYCKSFELRCNVKIDKKLTDFYQTLPWPGNYRQLKGHLERKKILSRSTHFDFDIYDEELIEQSSELVNLNQHKDFFSLDEVKEAYIKKVYYASDKNLTVTAKRLGISVKSIRRTVQKIYEPTI